MLIRRVKFTDYNGQEREMEYAFHLNKAETIQWMTTAGEYTLDKLLLRLAEERNGKRIMEIFEDLIHRSYGRKSLDGISFEKNEADWLAFKQSEAYSEIFCELVTDAKKAAAFVNGVIPADVAKDVQTALEENRDSLPDELKDYIPNKVGKEDFETV